MCGAYSDFDIRNDFERWSIYVETDSISRRESHDQLRCAVCCAARLDDGKVFDRVADLENSAFHILECLGKDSIASVGKTRGIITRFAARNQEPTAGWDVLEEFYLFLGANSPASERRNMSEPDH